MSVSPQISPPKTPDTKRPRSPTPNMSMADGVEEVGFRLRAGLIRYPQPGTLTDTNKELREDMAEHLAEVLADKIAKDNDDFKETLDLINTLFEVAAALTTIVVDPDHQEQLDVLHQHAIEGLDLIGGEEAPDWREEEGGLVRWN